MKNIVLTGFMASGKSTVGRALAQKLNVSFIDTDQLIETEQKRQIKDIFAQFGEPYFRTLETEAVRQVCRKDGQVIATGGGIVLNPKNIELFRKNSIIVFLYAGLEKNPAKYQRRHVRPSGGKRQKCGGVSRDFRKPAALLPQLRYRNRYDPFRYIRSC